MNHCKHCEKEIDNSFNFCPFCGEPAKFAYESKTRAVLSQQEIDLKNSKLKIESYCFSTFFLAFAVAGLLCDSGQRFYWVILQGALYFLPIVFAGIIVAELYELIIDKVPSKMIRYSLFALICIIGIMMGHALRTFEIQILD